VAGCGGGGLSHSEFVKRADAVCSAYRSQTKAQLRPHTYTEIVGYVDETLPLYDAALRKLEALKPPSSDADAVKAWLDADRRVAKATRELGVGAQRRDFPTVTVAASRASLAGSQSRQAAAALGMHVCATLATGR
jgi:hypothetical protein